MFPGTSFGKMKSGIAVIISRDRNKSIEFVKLKAGLQGAKSFPTVREYLAAVAKLPNNSFKFAYAWWELPTDGRCLQRQDF